MRSMTPTDVIGGGVAVEHLVRIGHHIDERGGIEQLAHDTLRQLFAEEGVRLFPVHSIEYLHKWLLVPVHGLAAPDVGGLEIQSQPLEMANKQMKHPSFPSYRHSAECLLQVVHRQRRRLIIEVDVGRLRDDRPQLLSVDHCIVVVGHLVLILRTPLNRLPATLSLQADQTVLRGGENVHGKKFRLKVALEKVLRHVAGDWVLKADAVLIG